MPLRRPEYPALRVQSRDALGTVKLGFYFGRVVMRFIEVTCVSRSLSHCFALVPHSAVGLTLTHATPAPALSLSCASTPEILWV